MTDSSASTNPPKKHKVMIPLRVTIAVPVEVDYTGDVSDDIYDEYNGDKCVDVENNPVLLKAAMKACANSKIIEDTLVSIVEVLLKHKVHNPESKVYYTRYAGLIDEREL